MKRSLWWKILLPGTFVLLLVICIVQWKTVFGTIASVAFIAPHWSTFKTVAARLPEERATTRKAGLPLTQADLARKTSLLPEENAAPLYREAFTHLDRVSEADTKIMTEYLKPENRSPEQSKKIRLLLASLRPALALTEKATKRPHCDFTVDRKENAEAEMGTEFPEMAKLRSLSRVFALRSVIEAQDQKPEAALQSVAVGMQIGRHAGQEPFLMPGLVEIAIRAIQHRQFVAVLRQYGSKPEALAAARASASTFGSIPDMRHGFRGEVVMTSEAMDKLPTDAKWLKELVDKTPYTKFSHRQRRTLADAWHVRLLEFWEGAFAVLNKAGDNRAKANEDFGQLADNEEKRWKNDPTYLMNGIFTPVFAKAGLKYLQCEAEARLQSTALSVLEERQRTGQFPAVLPGAVKTSTDPFDNQPLRYKRVGKGFLLYSVGRNFRDDGGRTVKTATSGSDKSDKTASDLTASDKTAADDIVISYP